MNEPLSNREVYNILKQTDISKHNQLNKDLMEYLNKTLNNNDTYNINLYRNKLDINIEKLCMLENVQNINMVLNDDEKIKFKKCINE